MMWTKLFCPDHRTCRALSILYDRSICEPRSHAVAKYKEARKQVVAAFGCLVEETETHVVVRLLLVLLLGLLGGVSAGVSASGGTASSGGSSTAAGADVAEQVLDVLALQSL